jgi:hypothetical protein
VVWKFFISGQLSNLDCAKEESETKSDKTTNNINFFIDTVVFDKRV